MHVEFSLDVQQKNRLEQKGLLTRFSITCYGHQESVEEMRADKAAKYKELKEKNDKVLLEEWFLNYKPDDFKNKKSDDNKEIKWTFNDNGTATSSNGKSVDVSDEKSENASNENASNESNNDGGGDGEKKGGKGGKGGNGGKPSYTPPPKDLPDGAERLKPKGGRPRYRLPDGDIIEWDGQHGEWEKYNPRGKHTGVLSPDGELIKDPVPGRRIEPIVKTTVNTAATLTAGYVIYKIIVGAATWECLGCGILLTP